MESDFEVLFVDEEKGVCELIYKKENYIIEKGIGLNEIHIQTEDGRKEKPKHVIPSTNYMSYDEYFHSEEFKEWFISDRLYSILADVDFIFTYGYENGFMMHYDKYKIIKNAHAAYYKDNMYHYINTDAAGDLVLHKIFDTEASFWEYLESTDYMQKMMKIKESIYQRQCVNGKYVSMQSDKRNNRYNNLRKKKILPLNNKTAQHSTPIMKKIHEKPSRELKDAVWLSIIEWSDQALPYQFVCIACKKKIDLRTGIGRYGLLGDFKCPFCGKKYFATIDDNPREHVYIYDPDNAPGSLFDNSKKPLYELVKIDKQY